MIPEDKIMHIQAGLIIFVLGWICIGYKFGLALAIFSGLLKEIHDWESGEENPEFMDFVATIGVPLIICLILKYIFKV